ncbi:MAG: AMP-binding protein [Verrucomicrobiota bacterium]
METARLTDPEYWQSDACDLRLNPQRPVDVAGLVDFIEQDLGILGAVVIPTSGTTGQPRFVVHTRKSLLASAAAVNRHATVTRDDHWLAGLATFHVGGLGIYARAMLSNSSVTSFEWDRWSRDGQAWTKAIEAAGATLASLTPTHLHDLVRHGVMSPRSLRGIFLGGGRIDPGLLEEAKRLGWPIWPSYGSSEAGSQVATSLVGDCDRLEILPCWEIRISDLNQCLALRGDALFSGYVMRDAASDFARWQFLPASDAEGWHETKDRVRLGEGTLSFLSRTDDTVKRKGELVSISALEQILAAQLEAIPFVVLPVPEPRSGVELILIVAPESKRLIDLDVINESLSPVERISQLLTRSSLPLTVSGKIDRDALLQEFACEVREWGDR